MFYKKVNKNNRQEMIDFLKNHKRYHTRNSTSKPTSYANAMEIIIACECLKEKELTKIKTFIENFENNNIGWTAGFNFGDKTQTYLMLYPLGRIPHTDTIVTCNYIFVDRERTNFNDEKQWPMNALRDRTKLIQAFDELSDNINKIR